jgi:hypothetical protein
MIEARAIRYAKSKGCELFKVKFAGRRGFPDRWLCIPPLRSVNSRVCNILIEFKAPLGRLAPVQILVHEELRTLGIEVWVINSSEYFEVALDARLQ